PMRRVIPGFFNLDLASLVVTWLAEVVLQGLELLRLTDASLTESPAVLSAVLFLALVQLVRLSIYVFMGAIIIQAVLSWFGSYHPTAAFFDGLTMTLLNHITRV